MTCITPLTHAQHYSSYEVARKVNEIIGALEECPRCAEARCILRGWIENCAEACGGVDEWIERAEDWLEDEDE